MEENQNKLTKFWNELKRRKVVQVIITYVSSSVALIALLSALKTLITIPDWIGEFFLILLIVCLPIAIIISWLFDISSKGITRTEPETNPDKVPFIESQKTVPEKSIIVLPFDNISSDPEQEYFSDGLTEEIITDLSHINDLLVISRSSAMTFKGTKQTIKEIAGKVNVRYVLEGSVRKSGNNLRIVAQLIDASNDSHIWAEKYTGILEDIFDIQEKVSQSITETLKLKLNPEEKEELTTHPIKNIEAYNVYLKARDKIWRGDEKSLENALQLLQKAIDIIGENEILIAGMGSVYFQYVNMGIKQEEYIGKINETVRRIFEMDPDSELGHMLTGIVYTEFMGDKKQGIKHLKIAYSKNPNNPEIILWLSFCYMVIGQMEKSAELVSRGVIIEPLNYTSYLIAAQHYYYSGQFEKALNELLKMELFDANNLIFLLNYAMFLVNNKDEKKSFSVIEKMQKIDADHGFSKLAQMLKFALLGDKEKISTYLTEELKMWAERDGQVSYWLASFYSLADMKVEAINWLENAIELYFINYPFLNEFDGFLNNIRKEPRFKKLMKKVKKEWENFEV